MNLFLIAVTNLSRNPRRTILNGAAMAVGAAVLIIAFGWIRGYFTTLYGGIRSFDVADAQVLDSRYLDDRLRLPLDELVPYRETERRLATVKGLAAAAGRLEFSGRLSSGGRSATLLCRGIDPAAEARITVLADHIVRGDYLGSSGGLLLGEDLAAKLGVDVGDMVFLSARDAYGAANVIDAKVAGLFKYGYAAMDEGLAFLDLPSAQDLLGIGDEVTSLALKAARGVEPDALVSAVARALPSGLTVYPWRRFAEGLVSAVRADSGSFVVLMVIVYLMIFLNVLNSLAVSVRERTRELGTLRAIGMKRRQIRAMVASEALSLAFWAGIAGSLLAVPAVIWLGRYGVDIAQYLPKDMPFPFGERFHADYRWWDFALTIVGGMVMAAVAAVPAAGRAARIAPAVAMRDSGE